MSTFHFPTSAARRSGGVRLAALATVIGAACLSAPLAVWAQSLPVVHHHHHMAKTAAEARETVEDRIRTLHEQLAITQPEEVQWAAVAQVMRDNEAGMQRMVAERRSHPPEHVTAIEDLKTYEHFTQEHVNGLKNLISSFEALYAVMTPAQQANADLVFQHFGAHARGLKS